MSVQYKFFMNVHRLKLRSCHIKFDALKDFWRSRALRALSRKINYNLYCCNPRVCGVARRLEVLFSLNFIFEIPNAINLGLKS